MTADEREQIDADAMTPEQSREVWPELRRYLINPCRALLFDALEARMRDEESRAEIFKRLKRKQQARKDAEAESNR